MRLGGLNEIMHGKHLDHHDSVVSVGCRVSLKLLRLLWKRPAIAPLGCRVSADLPNLPFKALFQAALNIHIYTYSDKPGLFVYCPRVSHRSDPRCSLRHACPISVSLNAAIHSDLSWICTHL